MKSSKHYNGAELRPFSARPGAMDAYALPSLKDGKQVPAGRIKPMLVGKPLLPSATGASRARFGE